MAENCRRFLTAAATTNTIARRRHRAMTRRRGGSSSKSTTLHVRRRRAHFGHTFDLSLCCLFVAVLPQAIDANSTASLATVAWRTKPSEMFHRNRIGAQPLFTKAPSSFDTTAIVTIVVASMEKDRRAAQWQRWFVCLYNGCFSFGGVFFLKKKK